MTVEESVEDKELQRTEYDALKEDVQLKAVIAGAKAKRLTINVSGIEIAIRGAIPKGLRDKLVMVAKAYQNEDLDTGDEEMYEVMSRICIDAPWNKPEAWRMIDEETGETITILRTIVEKIAGLEEAARRFRTR